MNTYGDDSCMMTCQKCFRNPPACIFWTWSWVSYTYGVVANMFDVGPPGEILVDIAEWEKIPAGDWTVDGFLEFRNEYGEEGGATNVIDTVTGGWAPLTSWVSFRDTQFFLEYVMQVQCVLPAYSIQNARI